MEKIIFTEKNNRFEKINNNPEFFNIIFKPRILKIIENKYIHTF